jgi:hypothetical protein
MMKTAKLIIIKFIINYGDPKIVHFIGIHSSQALHLVSYYSIKNTKSGVIASIL